MSSEGGSNIEFEELIRRTCVLILGTEKGSILNKQLNIYIEENGLQKEI